MFVFAKAVFEKSFCRISIAFLLHQYINEITILINGSPEIMPLAMNVYKYLIHIPSITVLTGISLQTFAIYTPEFSAPRTNCFITDRNPSLRKKIFNITKAETKAVVYPNSILNNFWWKSMVFININWSILPCMRLT